MVAGDWQYRISLCLQPAQCLQCLLTVRRLVGIILYVSGDNNNIVLSWLQEEGDVICDRAVLFPAVAVPYVQVREMDDLFPSIFVGLFHWAHGSVTENDHRFCGFPAMGAAFICQYVISLVYLICME